jgi:serine/threonine-protein kinase
LSNDDTLISDSSKSIIFCAGCNERFQRLPGSTRCPRCGATAGLLNELALDDTLLIRDSTHIDRQSSEDEDDKDDLIGGNLHVYHCQSLIGRGGMGRVYLAFHNDLERQCALKVLSPRQANQDTDYVARFIQEGKAAAALEHPNIVTTHAVGQVGDYHFLEMEFVAGRSLQQLISDEGRLTPVRATTLIAQTAAGLAEAHLTGIIHRDLKPDNILLTQQGIPKISDFGLAKRIAPHQGGETREVLCGTPHYMAPELFRGEPATPRSDVYALGVCYFLLLTGRMPFLASSLMEFQQKSATEPIPDVREEFDDISLEMAECLNRLMAKSPANRTRDAVEAVQLLQAVLGQLRDIESLLTEAFLNETGIKWERQDSRYVLQLKFDSGRGQTVIVEPTEHSLTERLLVMSSICCEAQPEFFEKALRMNSDLPHGGLAIQEIDGRSMFVVVDTYPRSTVDPEEIRRSVLTIARQADEVEHLLTGLDVH